MKLFYRILADCVFVLHLVIVLVALFGWVSPRLWNIYMVLLLATLISDIVLGYCILSKLEFDLRKKIDPDSRYDFTWTTYYTHKITNKRISNTFFKRTAITYLILCLCVNLYFKFLW